MSNDEARYCPVCRGARFGKFCHFCGGPTITVSLKCPHCSENATVLSKFCCECGKPIHEEVREHIAREMQKNKEVKDGEGSGSPSGVDSGSNGVEGSEK